MTTEDKDRAWDEFTKRVDEDTKFRDELWEKFFDDYYGDIVETVLSNPDFSLNIVKLGIIDGELWFCEWDDFISDEFNKAWEEGGHK